MDVNGQQLKWLRDNGLDHIADQLLELTLTVRALKERLATYEPSDQTADESSARRLN